MIKNKYLKNQKNWQISISFGFFIELKIKTYYNKLEVFYVGFTRS